MSKAPQHQPNSPENVEMKIVGMGLRSGYFPIAHKEGELLVCSGPGPLARPGALELVNAMSSLTGA